MPFKKKPGFDLEEALREASEGIRRTATKPNLYSYKPHHKQEQYHKSVKKTRLYIGGNRSGKTTGGVVEGIWWATGNHPYLDLRKYGNDIRQRVCAVDYENGMEKIILPQFKQWCPPSKLKGGSWDEAWSPQHRTLEFEDGDFRSFIEFMSYDQDVDKYAGTSRHRIHEDEEPPKEIHRENQARLIDTDGVLDITMTPVEGMTWVYDEIYEPGLLGLKDIEVIMVAMEENPHLNPAVVQKYLSELDEEDRLARGEGKFVQMGGLIYKKFDPKPGGLHVIDDNAWIPPRDWDIYVSIDSGFKNPTAVGWHATSPDGDVITFREHYASEMVVSEHAAAIMKINKEIGRMPSYYIGDPAMKQKRETTGTSVQQEYIRFGIPVMCPDGINDVKAGIQRVNRYMRPRVSRGGETVAPLWHTTTSCPMLCKELTRYKWKSYQSKKTEAINNPYDEPQKKDDHACDMLRYFLMSRPDFSETMDHPNLEQRLATNFGIQVIRGSGAEEYATAKEVDTEVGEWAYDESMEGVYW